MKDFLSNLFNRQLFVRRVMLVWMALMTTLIIRWSLDFAMTSPRAGADIAMILGAILAPWTTLQGFVFKFYNEARSETTGE